MLFRTSLAAPCIIGLLPILARIGEICGLKIINPKCIVNVILTFCLLIGCSSFVLAEETEKQKQDEPAPLPQFVAEAEALESLWISPEVGFDAFHVQGIAVTDDHFFFTSVNKLEFAAWIFKLDRKDMKLVEKRNISKSFNFHPSGIDYDGKYIWVAVAVYSPESHTNMMIVDPENLKSRKVFEVQDHIGVVARHKDLVIGANWDAKQFYFWTRKGKLVDKRESPTGVGYQDCEGVEGFLMCVGGGYLDWIDIDGWVLSKRFPLGVSKTGAALSREGVSLHGSSVFFLPDDGPQSQIYEYTFSKDAKNAKAIHNATEDVSGGK